MKIQRYAKAIASALAGVVVVGGAMYSNAPPEGLEAQHTALASTLGGLLTGLAAFWPRNAA